jgi:hypothetical protein
MSFVSIYIIIQAVEPFRKNEEIEESMDNVDAGEIGGM